MTAPVARVTFRIVEAVGDVEVARAVAGEGVRRGEAGVQARPVHVGLLARAPANVVTALVATTIFRTVSFRR